MDRIEPDALRPAVRHANFIDVSRGMVWGPRRIQDFEFVLAVSGELIYEADSCGKAVVKQGELLLIEPQVDHILRESASGGRTVISCIHFEPLAGKSYSDGGYELVPAPPTITDTESSYVIRDLFLRCASTMDGYSRYREALLSCIFHELWVRLAEIWSGGGAAFSPRMREMHSFIRRNLRSNVGRVMLAEEFKMTPQHVNAVFKCEMRLTPTEFIHRERVRLAYRLMMEEGLSVKEAAARVGFNDQFYFSRVFKHIMKFAPSRSI